MVVGIMIANPANQALPGCGQAVPPRHPRSFWLATFAQPERRHDAIEAAHAARAFAAGFARGADPERMPRRHVVDVDHEHWLRGYEAGQRAADRAATRYLGYQLHVPRSSRR